MKAAVDDNVNAIAGRVPPTLRPVRRRLRLWSGRLTWLSAVGAVVIVASGFSRWPASAHTPSAPDAAPGGSVRADVPGGSAVPAETADAHVAPSGTVPPDVLALAVRRIVINPGHGGTNRGTESTDGALVEKEVTLDIASRTRAVLVSRRFEAVMTRTVDDTVSLHQRAELANGRRGDIFVSVHLNSLRPSTAGGVETYYLGPGDAREPNRLAAIENEHSGYSLADMRVLLERIYDDARRAESKRLAGTVQHALMEGLRAVDGAIENRGVKMAPFVVLGATEMPAILAEVSCLSNSTEADRLRTASYRQTIANALAAGIQTFAGATTSQPAERNGNRGI